MEVYLTRSDGALCKWEGMTEQAVLDMLAAQGLSGTIMTAEEYNTALAALQPQP